MRSAWANASTVSEKAKLDNQLSESLKTIMAISESYPDLKANQNFMDLQNNLYVLSLTIFDEYNYQRAERYLSYMYLINSKYHFIENACLFKKAMHDE